MTTTVLLAGSTGMLGNRIAQHLLDQPDVALRLLLRAPAPPGSAKAELLDALVARGADIVTGDVTDPASLDAATTGANVVVSALQGGPEIIVDGQVALAEAAARNGVRRFIPSDFALDLFSAPEGAPQFDMRRRADRAINALPLQVVHILNGAFMDMMLDPDTAAIVDLKAGTASVWGTGDEPFNLTTVEDTARFTAKVATDPNELSGVLYLSGAETTFNTIIDETEHISGTTLTRSVRGSVEDLRRITSEADDPWSVVPQWYFLSMLTVAPFPTNDNQRYPDARPTGLHDYLVEAHRAHHTGNDHLTAGYAYQPGDAPAYWNFGTYWRLLATSETTSGRSTTFDELFPRGTVAPPHVHDDAEEAFFVLEGDLVFTLGDHDEEITAPPGTYVYIPPGTRHSFRCGSEVGRVYNTLTPGGFDHGIIANGTPAPRVEMPAPGNSALTVWQQLLPGRPPTDWPTTDVASW
jgi:uncharacterized protein YbjT (DUF2867 family)/quercetin dioxygenase-like cupin family protein